MEEDSRRPSHISYKEYQKKVTGEYRPDQPCPEVCRLPQPGHLQTGIVYRRG